MKTKKAQQQKSSSSNFKDYLIETLKTDDMAVFYHIRNALEEPHLDDNDDYRYLFIAINDVARARGKSEMAEHTGLSRQGLDNILNGKSVPSIQNVISILNFIGLKFSVEQIENLTADHP